MYVDKFKEYLSENCSWFKLAFFAFCVAFFLFLLQVLFAPKTERYKPLYRNGAHNFYMDTSTGAIYNLRGELFSRPSK